MADKSPTINEVLYQAEGLITSLKGKQKKSNQDHIRTRRF